MMNILLNTLSALLSVYGFVVYHFQKLNNLALREYKTKQIRKNNRGVLFVGGVQAGII